MGLALIAAVLEREGYQVTVLDANALRLQPEDIVPMATDADVVGLTAMTPTVSAAISIAHHLKRAKPDLTIVLGGAHATLLPEETLAAAPEIDVILRGEGEDYYENLWLTNAVGTKNMIRLQEKKEFRMIFFSSAEVYGDYDGVMSEDVMDKVAVKQMNDYAMTKWVGELQVLNSAAMFGTETVRVRPVNAYGPHEYYSPYRGVIPAFIYKALRDESYTVYLGHKRIFDYIEDTCRT
ncbi:unnamed protein product, partial [marine sediment metagenome]